MGLRNPHNDALTRSDYLAQQDLRAGIKESYVNAPMVPARPPWQEMAACRGVGPDLFFPERGEQVAAALAYCDTCPVVAECRTYSENLDDQTSRFGVWGGLPANQRRTSKVVQILIAEGRSPACTGCDLRPVRYRDAGLCSRCYERQRARRALPSTYTCAICQRSFGSLKGAHQHLAGSHWIDDRAERARNVITRMGRPAKVAPIRRTK